MPNERSPFGDFRVIHNYNTQDSLDDGTLVDAATQPDLRTVTLLNWNTDRKVLLSQ
jgi:hypothetical protein